MGPAFLLSKRYTGKILLRYFSINIEGILYLEISDELKEQVGLLKTLSTIGSDNIPGYNAAQAFIADSVKFILLSPDYRLTDLSTDTEFGITYNNGSKSHWNVDSIFECNFDPDRIIQCESLFVEVGKDQFWVTLVPYENKYFYSRVFTDKIKLTLLGL